MVFALRDLFQAAFELKKKENDMKGESTEKPAADSAAASAPAAASPTTAAAPAASTPAPSAAAAAQPSLVLLCIHKHRTCVYRLS